MLLNYNPEVLNQSISGYLRQAKKAGYPQPFPLSPVYGTTSARRKIIEEIYRNQRDRLFHSRPIYYEVPKKFEPATRMLSRHSIEQAVEYHCLARHFCVRSGRLVNGISYSFRPQTQPREEIWVDEFSNPYGRWIGWEDFQISSLPNFKFCISADIEDYFPNIRHDILISAIWHLFGDDKNISPLLHRLCELLASWYPDLPIGLPQSGSASFFFAELPLLAIDGKVWYSATQMSRFVDDYLIAGKTEQAVFRHYEQREAVIEEAGFTFNKHKFEFCAADVIIERIERRRRMKERYFLHTSHLSSEQYDERVRIAANMLLEELREGDFCRYTVNFLLGRIIGYVKRSGSVSDERHIQLLECFEVHSSLVADALISWLPVLSEHADSSGVQELMGAMLDGDMLDTERAFCYHIFGAAGVITSADLREKIVDRFETDACMKKADWNGSTTARTGKALRAAQRHGKGDDVLMELYRHENFDPEMRLYTAVASSDLPDKYRQEFQNEQRRTCRSLEESIALNYFEKNNDPGIRRSIPLMTGY